MLAFLRWAENPRDRVPGPDRNAGQPREGRQPRLIKITADSVDILDCAVDAMESKQRSRQEMDATGKLVEL